MKKKVWLLAAALVVLGMLAAQCGPAPTPEVIEKVVTKEVEKVVTQEVEVEKVVTKEVEVEKVVTQEVEKQVEVVVTPTPAPKGQARYGGTVTEGWYQTLNTWDPWTFHTAEEQKAYKRVYSFLVNVTPDLTIEPNLAKSWEISEDAKTFTFHLHENATWHDGEPVTAADVKFTFERGALPASSSRFAPQAALLEGAQDFLDGKADEISGLKVLDDHTIQFVLIEPNVALLTTLYNQVVAPKHIFEDIPVEEVGETEYATSSPIGSGPWKVANYIPDQIIELERNPDYFIEGLPYIDKYVYRIFQNQPAMVAALEAGEIDLAELVPADIARIEAIPYLGVQQYKKRAAQHMVFNTKFEPWNDLRVRQALAHAIDLEGLCASAFLGACEPVGHTYPQTWTWSPKAATYPYDPEKARALLEEAGFDFDKEYTMLTYYTSNDPVAIQAMLADIGVKVKVLVLDTPAYLEERTKDTWDLQYLGTFGSADPNDVVADVSTCGEEDTHYLRYCNPEVEELEALGPTVVDFEARKKVYQQIDEIITAELPWYSLVTAQIAMGYNRRVVNFQYSRFWDDAAETWYVFE
jgi:peptide/nickel transport system substrate-binding protein